MASGVRMANCAQVKVASVTNNRRIVCATAAKQAPNQAAKQAQCIPGFLLAGFAAAAVVTAGPALADSLFDSGSQNEQELKAIIAGRGKGLSIQDLPKTEQAVDTIAKDKANQVLNEQIAKPQSFLPGATSSSPSSLAPAEGPSAVTLLGLGAVVVAGAAVFANKQEEGDLPNVSAAANGVASDAQAAASKVENKAEDVVEDAAAQAESNSKNAQKWISNWRANQ